MNINLNKIKVLLIILATIGLIILFSTIIIYSIHSHIKWMTDVDKDYFGILGEFIGGVVGTLFSIITTVLVYLAYSSQQKDIVETKKLLQKQIDISIKPDLFFTNSSFYGFSKMGVNGISYALDFSREKKLDIFSSVTVDLVNVGVGVAKNIEFYWEFNLEEIQTYLADKFPESPLTMLDIDKNFVEFRIESFEQSIYISQIFYKIKRRFDILLSHKESSPKLPILFPKPYLICYFIAVKLSMVNHLNNFNSFSALDDFPKCNLSLTYCDILANKHLKTFDFVFSGHGSFIPEPKQDGSEMFGYDLYPIEIYSQ